MKFSLQMLLMVINPYITKIILVKAVRLVNLRSEALIIFNTNNRITNLVSIKLIETSFR